jgi:transcriptional regulator with XRE-family HTH domain
MTSEIDIQELARSIRAKRGDRGLRAIAKEITETIGEVSASTLSRVEQGKVPDLDTFIRLCKWLGLSTSDFAMLETDLNSEGKTLDVVAAHLRADRTLDSKTVEALVTMIQMAYATADSE